MHSPLASITTSEYGQEGTALLRVLLVLLLLLIVILLASAEQAAEEAAFFGFGLLLGLVVLSVLRARLTGLLRLARGQHSGLRAGRQLLLLAAAEPEELLEEVSLVLIGMGAGIPRSRAVEKSRVVVVGAGLIGEEIGVLVELDQIDALRDGEVARIGVLRKLNGAFHELRPDGGGELGAFGLDVGVVVIAHPDDTDQVGGVSGKPGIVRCAGFAGC